MELSGLLDILLIKKIIGNVQQEINGIKIDSRSVQPGDLFICFKGSQADGHQYVADAVANGAIALVVEQPINMSIPGITIIQVPDSRRAMAILADYFYGHPSKELKLIGITGTNGKTTTTHMIEKILNDAEKQTGLIGTLYMKMGDHQEKTVNTTPDANDLHKYLRFMRNLGAQYAVVEVSSHALSMGRVRGGRFRTAIFTNLTHDHLDYHGSMSAYLEAKTLLFSQLGNSYENSDYAVLNVDDSAFELIANRTTAQIVRYGLHEHADVRATNIAIGQEGQSFIAETFMGTFPVKLGVHGLFNVYNALAAISVCLIENVPIEQIQVSLESFQGVKGRFQYVRAGQKFTVIVDYAHNPDGLKSILAAAQEIIRGKVVCVIGCEGDRDRSKRPLMARIAADYSDVVIMTSDNPRSEDPDEIINEMIAGLDPDDLDKERIIAIVDRRKAIEYALQVPITEEDCILVVGKGHEDVQIWKNQSIPFNDEQVIIDLLGKSLASNT